MPIGTHLVLQEHADHEEILLDGDRLGGVVAQTADRFNTPLAVPLMDLKLEKEALLEGLGIPGGGDRIVSFQRSACRKRSGIPPHAADAGHL